MSEIANMPQEIINYAFAGLGALSSFLLNAVWQSVKDLHKSDKEIAEKIANIEVLVAGDYVKKNEFSDYVKAMFVKLDKIEDKLDRKVDKA